MKCCILLWAVVVCLIGGDGVIGFTTQHRRIAFGRNIAQWSAASPISCFADHLQELLLQNDTSTITIEGYVTASRQIGKALVFVDFLLPNNGGNCDALLKQDEYRENEYDGHRLALVIGSRLKVTGRASTTRNPGQAIFLIYTLQLLDLPRQPQLIQKILTLAKDGRISYKDVAVAARRPNLMKELQESSLDVKAFSKLVLAGLPYDPNYPIDEKKRSQKGNYTLPLVPFEWLTPPLQIIDHGTPLDTFSSVAELLLATTTTTTTATQLVTLAGWVQNRRRFQDNITMLKIVDDASSTSDDDDTTIDSKNNRLACLLHPLLLQSASLYKTILTPGSRVWMQGQLVPSTTATTTTLWVTHIRLLQASWRPVTLRHVLDLVFEKKLDLDEVSEALGISYQEATELSETSDATERQWKAMELSSTLQQQQQSQTFISPDLLSILDKYKSLREQFPVVQELVDFGVQQRGNTTLLSGTKWQTKKQPQLVWMTSQIRSVIESHPEYGKRIIHILDVGGGKGLLANHLGRMLDQVQIHVVDIAAGAIKNGAMRSKRIKVPVDYQLADASSSTSLEGLQVDVVIALHACGHLSDVALAHAVQRGGNVGFVICPCCFRSNSKLCIPKTKEVVEDWLGIPTEDWNAMKLMAEAQGDKNLQSLAAETICAIRASAASRCSGVDVTIKSFPIQYSTRNLCLVGTVSTKR